MDVRVRLGAHRRSRASPRRLAWIWASLVAKIFDAVRRAAPGRPAAARSHATRGTVPSPPRSRRKELRQLVHVAVRAAPAAGSRSSDGSLWRPWNSSAARTREQAAVGHLIREVPAWVQRHDPRPRKSRRRGEACASGGAHRAAHRDGTARGRPRRARSGVGDDPAPRDWPSREEDSSESQPRSDACPSDWSKPLRYAVQSPPRPTACVSKPSRRSPARTGTSRR